MKAVLFRARNGEITVEDVPAPQLNRGQVLVANEYSLISSGTESATVSVGRQSLVGKARSRPDQVRQVLESARKVGPLETFRVVTSRLDEPKALGYSCAGRVLAVGQGVDGVRVGDRVAAGGGGYASHAELVSVPKNLCVPVPPDVSSRWAAFSTVGAIALRGIHQTSAPPGSRIAVIGLGLVGQLAARSLVAYGYDVVGVDLNPRMVSMASQAGIPAFARSADDLATLVRHHWDDAGADAVIVTAATSSSDPVSLAGEVARDRAVVVIVGDAYVSPPRSTFYGKELEIRYSRSYGPGRYDPRYEESGESYPEGFVPWPERRNLAEFVRLLHARRVDLEGLAPSVYPVAEASAAYEALTDPDRRPIAILLSYDAANSAKAVPSAFELRPASVRPGSERVRISSIGAGSFATRNLLPHLKRDQRTEFSWILSAGGVSAQHQGRRWGFRDAVVDLDQALSSGSADAVLVVTRHDSHAEYVCRTLRSGTAVFVEKPLALNEGELESVADAWLTSGVPAMVGFNRRFAPAVVALKPHLAGRGALHITYRIFAGRLPRDHWYFDATQGGRVVGEMCHFIDTASYLVESAPVDVWANGDVDNIGNEMVSAAIQFDNGSTATVVYGGRTPSGAPKELIEVAGDGVAARIDDFNSLTLWTKRETRTRFKGSAKGHAEEMAAFVGLVRGEAVPGTDFRLSLWSTYLTLGVLASARSGEIQRADPSGPALRAALGLPPG